MSLLMSKAVQVLCQELSLMHVWMLNVILLFLTWISQFYGHSCMLLDGQLSPSCQPKTPTSKNLFPTPSTKVIPVSPSYLPISFVLFQVCLSCSIVFYLHFSMKIFMLLIVMGKVGYIALTNLMHTDTSILHHYFYIITYCYSLIFIILRYNIYIILPVLHV